MYICPVTKRSRQINKRCKCGCNTIVRRANSTFVKGHRTAEYRFWSKVEKIEGGCWIWKGAVVNYRLGCDRGVIHYKRKNWLATHFMWIKLLKRKIPKGLFVLHWCDNPRCIRPEHLFLGTLSQNAQQMWLRERRQCKIPKSKYPEILEKLTQGETIQEIAEYYGVGKPWVRQIKARIFKEQS